MAYKVAIIKSSSLLSETHKKNSLDSSCSPSSISDTKLNAACNRLMSSTPAHDDGNDDDVGAGTITVLSASLDFTLLLKSADG